MTIKTIHYTQLEKRLRKTNKSLVEYLAPKSGKIYVINITRQNCPSCEKQKPKLEKLAATLTEQYSNKIIFTNIHVNYTKNDPHESNRSKTILGHDFYPTTFIFINNRAHGTINTYKNIEPTTTELRNNIKKNLTLINPK